MVKKVNDYCKRPDNASYYMGAAQKVSRIPGTPQHRPHHPAQSHQYKLSAMQH